MAGPAPEARAVEIAAGDVDLAGELILPEGASALVLLAHDSGPSRDDPGDRSVARRLVEAGLAALLLDLLAPAEAKGDLATGDLRLDVFLLADRLLRAAEWVGQQRGGQHLRIGCFGAGAVAAAALVTAAARPDVVGAIVSRGGRPDLAASALRDVCAPTLLVVGGEDRLVRDLNEFAYSRLRCERRLEIVPGATHLFEEPGTLERVADLAAAWFRHFLVGEPARSAPPGAPPSYPAAP